MNKEDKNIPEELNSKIEYDGVPKIKDGLESNKYIKEMYKLADKNQTMHKVVGLGLCIVVVSVIILSILINAPFMKPKTAVATPKAVTKTAVDNTVTKVEPIKPVETQEKIYEYLNIEANRTSVLQKAVGLNKGNQKGITVYLLSEILRSNAVAIPENTTTVEALMKTLTSMGWQKNTDFTKLEKGDICFTIDMPDKPGVPSHAYVFMDWVANGKTDYANICDGQLEDNNTIFHQRNISISTTKKDKFGFFLRK